MAKTTTKSRKSPKEDEDIEPRRRAVVRKEVVISYPVVKVPAMFQGFIDFIREQGVVGLAVGLVLGTQVKVLVDSLIASFISPLLGLVLPGGGSLAQKTFTVTINGKTQVFTWGAFFSQLLSFVVVVAVVYIIIHRLKLDRMDKKKV